MVAAAYFSQEVADFSMNSNHGKKRGQIVFSSHLLAVTFLVLMAGCSKETPSISLSDKSVQADSCAHQLVMLADAKKNWAEKENKTTNDTPVMADLTPFMRYPSSCPGGGTYTLGVVGQPPSCSIPEHQAAFLKKLQTPAAPAP